MGHYAGIITHYAVSMHYLSHQPTQPPSKTDTVTIFPILQMSLLRIREVKYIAHSHTADKRLNLESNQGLVRPKYQRPLTEKPLFLSRILLKIVQQDVCQHYTKCLKACPLPDASTHVQAARTS